MRRIVSGLLGVAMAGSLVACEGWGEGATTTTEPPPPPLGAASPAEAVQDWLTQLGDRDYQSTEQVVEDAQLALLAALEGMSAEHTVRMLEEGVPAEVRQNFWRAFSESFPAFSGEQIGELVVGDVERFTIGGDRFAAVQVVFRERIGSGEVVTRRNADGRWFVDLFATFGHAFARPLGSWLEQIPPTGAGARVREALGEYRTSLEALLEREPLGEISETTISELRMVIAQL